MASPSTVPTFIHQSYLQPPILIHQSDLQPPISTSAFRNFTAFLSSNIRQGLLLRRPWTELLDPSAFTLPDSLTDAASRLRKNFSYFRVNYVSIISLSLTVFLLAHPFCILVLLALLAAWLFLYLFRPSDPPLAVCGRTFSDRETLGILILSSVIVLFLTDVGFLLLYALLLGLAVVCTHGAFRLPEEELFLVEQEETNPPFLSFLYGAAATAGSASPAAAPHTR